MARTSVFAPVAAAHGRSFLRAAIIALTLSSAVPLAAVEPAPDAEPANGRMIIVALADKPDPATSAASTPRGYVALPGYAGGSGALASAKRIAADYRLREVSAWNIPPLRLRCMLYEVAGGDDRDAILERLRTDPRIRLAQPQHDFETLTAAEPPVAATGETYNDPYIGLQHGFSSIGADLAQHWSSGQGIRVAVVDTGIDAAHPDLAGRVIEQRDFAGAHGRRGAQDDRHGTEVAGVIAAVANNHVGIVGVAPAAQLLSYRACWPSAADAGVARCNTFTLAQAIGAAIASKARLINLSLGGPSDPLLAELIGYALGRGVIVVGAVPPSGRMDGFPVGIPGVIAVTDADDQVAQVGALAAPGRDVLTLEPGGHYDYASGSSLSTAHVSGAIALLLQVDGDLTSKRAVRLLGRADPAAGASIDVCAAMVALGHGEGCRASVPSPGARHASR